MSPDDVRMASRNEDGDGSAEAARGRTSHSQVSVPWAARFSRLSASGRAFDCHRRTASNAPLLGICSADHRASAELVGLSQYMLRSFTRQARQVIECGRKGG